MEEKAKGGWGLLITEDYCAQPAGKGYSRIPGFWEEEHVESSRRVDEYGGCFGMARGSLADPYLPAKAKEGRFEAIRYCIGCLQGCEMPLFMDDSAPRCRASYPSMRQYLPR